MPAFPFTDERLDNGLRVVLSEDHAAPVVAVNLWYNVGSRHETRGLTGFAHLFEHLMFEGSRNVQRGEHFALVNAAGGTLNGSTWCDRTNYYEVVPSNHLELMLWLEADRMGGLLDALSQETLDNQREVVKNEKRQSFDNAPYGSYVEKLHEAVFPDGHPYHHSTIGSMQDLNAASLEDVQNFFQRYYAPNNAVLSVVGDFETDEARRWVERYFGGIDRNDDVLAAPDGTVAAHIGREIREVVPDRVQLERVFMGWRSPPYGTREFDALYMATAVAGMGRGSRLHQELVLNRQLAMDVSLGPWPFVGGASMTLGATTARSGVPAAEAEAVFHEVVESLTTGVTDEELARARGLVERHELSELQGVGGRADNFSEAATLFDDPGVVNRRLEGWLSVTPDEIARVAADVFVPDNRVVLTYVPEAEGSS
ncbi:MAG TPA: pitrilysin family protein [Acidimicrobiales bacterium]|nr:pitrilysin family protein [Acidimicrobiales bacterium]